MKTILELREALGMTQKQLATRLNVSIQSISLWENGHYSPSHLAQEKIDQLIKERTNV